MTNFDLVAEFFVDNIDFIHKKVRFECSFYTDKCLKFTQYNHVFIITRLNYENSG